MALLGVNLTQVSLEAEAILQPDPDQACVGQGEDTREEDIVRNRGISGRSRQSEGEGAGRSLGG